jgi:hypothetical protein
MDHKLDIVVKWGNIVSFLAFQIVIGCWSALDGNARLDIAGQSEQALMLSVERNC